MAGTESGRPAELAAGSAGTEPSRLSQPAAERPVGAEPKRPVAPAAECPAGAGPRPADAARAALRATFTAPSDVTAAAEDECSAGAGSRPADAARAALRSTVTAPSAATAPSVVTPPSAPTASAEAEDEDERPVRSARPAAAQSGRAAAPGGRPADVAREALRAARREAQRAEAEAAEAAARGKRTPEPRTGRDPRATNSSASTAPRTAPGLDSRATARVKAAQEMRHYLANAFQMPTWSDTPEQETPATDPSAHSGDPAHPGQSRPAPALPSDDTELVHPRASRPAPADPAEAAEPVHPWQSRPAPAPPSDGTEPDHPAPASAAPRLPATMATPHRDSELRRTFPEFPPREATGEGAPFAGTWWGNAWVAALEQGALDPKRLTRGRGYADQGHVDAITVTPGLVLAYVRGSRPRPYRVQVRVRTLDDEDWGRFLDSAADRPGHIAALLDKELPQPLADCGVPLLPGPGDLAPRCSCPDSGHPCKHAAALCYQTARLLDADPFVLLLLRGRGEKALLDALSRRSAARAARAAQDRRPESLPGVRATDALAARQLPPLPPPLPAPSHPEQPPVYPAAPGGPDPFALDQLATDAAARAHALLTTGHDPVGELTLWQDAVRLAAARPGSGLTATTRTLYATLATAVDRTPADLARAVAAWRQGGLAGLAVLEEPWDPPAGRFDRARPLLLAADLPAFRPWRNHLTHPRGHIQLRFGRDGLWYAYESEPGHDDWWPRGTPDLDPVGALTGLGTPDDR
ncbi:SWIM zinc finger family protein [Streptomyces sp. NPDC001250]|uniref:SWIM zinc finger family protein n=1 Tax=unclassified Streptomyces TaxID=2593676 RepID=UPI00331EEA3B